jgi:hypothetical protein
MKTVELVRLGLAGVLVYFALNGGVSVNTSTPDEYDGPFTKINQHASKMDPSDRQGLSEALMAVGKMIEDDKLKLINNTEQLQKAVQGAINYGYTSFSIKQYPELADEIKVELDNVIGDKVILVSDNLRSQVSNTMIEMSKAIK